LTLFRELGDTWNIADVLGSLGAVVCFVATTSWRRYGGSLACFASSRIVAASPGASSSWGTWRMQGDLSRAATHTGAGVFRQLEQSWMIANLLLPSVS
jgi:hypothetical protein